MLRLAKAATQPWREYAETDKGPLLKVPDLLDFGSDCHKRFPKARLTNATLISDFAFTYYGPSVAWNALDPVTYWQIEKSGIDPVHGDGLEFLRITDIKYVWIVDPDIFSKSPPAWLRIIPKLEPMPSRIGKLYRVAPSS